MAKEAVPVSPPAEPEVAPEPVQAVQSAPVVVQKVEAPRTVRARVKGTWDMNWGGVEYPFVDREYFEIPADLFDFLRRRDCIYDTMA